jgi:hypothetical protein
LFGEHATRKNHDCVHGTGPYTAHDSNASARDL